MSQKSFKSLDRIICLTEESVEILFDLGKGDLIAGVSSYVRRPKEARKIEKVSLFTSSKIERIVALNPDLVLGFSDLQKDIAQELIGRGLNVFIANHRSLEEILRYVQWIGRLVSDEKHVKVYTKTLVRKIESIRKKAGRFEVRPRVYFEEWDDPMITAIRWVSEAIEVAGGENVFAEKSLGSLAKDRFVKSQEILSADPEFIFACWCGKKVRLKDIRKREGWDQLSAVKKGLVFECAPEIFLQPGPALIKEGLDYFYEKFSGWQS